MTTPRWMSTSSSMNFFLPTIAPAIRSLDPEMYLVQEWTTTSAQKRAGEISAGVNVLSTTRGAPFSFASRPRALGR